MGAPLRLTEEDMNNQDVLATKLIQLAEIVVRKHFYASYQDKDDLVSIGVLKALTLIKNGAWSKSRGSFLNYIYSGMRNDMHNYLYHQNKFNFVDNETLPDNGKYDMYFNSDECYLDYNLVHSVCSNFTTQFGEYIEDRVIKEMTELGYTIVNREDSKKTQVSYCNIIGDMYGKDTEDDVTGRIIGIILWEKKEIDYIG